MARHPITVVPIESLTLDKTLQRREGEDKERIGLFADLYREHGIEALPALVVFTPDATDPTTNPNDRWVADGFHRFKAAKKADLTEIRVELRRGDRRDALFHALGANGEHGKPTTLDERRANCEVLFADEEWRQFSDKVISKHVHLSPNTVGKIRKACGAEVAQVTGVDGVKRAKSAPKSWSKALAKAHTEALIAALAVKPGMTGAEVDVALKEALGKKYRPAWSTEELPGISMYRAGWYLDGQLEGWPKTWNGADVELGDRIQSTNHAGEARDGWIVGWDAVENGPVIKDEDNIRSVIVPPPAAASQDPAAEATSAVTPQDVHELADTIRQHNHSNLHPLKRLILAACYLESEPTRERLKALIQSSPDVHPGQLVRSDLIYSRGDAYGLTDEGNDLVEAAIDARDIHDQAADEDEDDDDTAANDTGPALAATEPEVLTLPKIVPIGQRRANWIRDHVATRLDAAPTFTGTTREGDALILLVGIPTNIDDTWTEAFVQGAQHELQARLARELADRLRRGETTRLPDWQTLARFWGIDVEAVRIHAERAIPE